MIAKMSKIEIVGPKDFLQDVLVLLKKLNVLQIEPESAEPVQGEAREEKIRPFLYDQRERTLYERLFLDDLRRKIDELFILLPKIPVRSSYIQPQAIVGTILYAIEKHMRLLRIDIQRIQFLSHLLQAHLKLLSLRI